MSPLPPDWIAGETLNPSKVRELEREGDLYRHHVFSRDALKKADVTLGQIQSGLNGVVLDEKANRSLAKAPPEEYREQAFRSSRIDRNELRSRIEQHFVPYVRMTGKGSILKRYDEFLNERARVVAYQITLLARL